MRGDTKREDNPFQIYIDRAFTVADYFADQHSLLSTQVATCNQSVQGPVQECVPLGIELLDILKTFRQIIDSMSILEYHKAKKVVPDIVKKFQEIKQKLTAAKGALKKEPDSRERTEIRQNMQEVIKKIESALQGLKILQRTIEQVLR